MWSVDKVNLRIARLRVNILCCKIEVKQLHTILHSDETMESIVEGELIKIHDRAHTGWGLAILTNRRIIFYRKSMFGIETKEETPISKISSVSYRKGLMQSTLHVYTSNNESVIKCMDKYNCEKVSQRLQQLMHSPVTIPIPVVPPKVKNDDMIDNLERLFSLKEKGAISDEEFQLAKQKLLST